MFKLLSLCLLLKYGEQLEGRNSIKEYKKMMYINTNILLHKDHKIGKICTLGIFLCLILWEIFRQLCPIFLRRTRCVRWWNLGAAVGKSATKASAGNTPRVHILITIEITIRYSFLNINRISKLSNYLSVKYIRNILDIPQSPSIVHFSSRNKRENCYLIH